MKWTDLKGIKKQAIPSHLDLLRNTDQKEVFQCILGFYPDLRKRYKSIFRADNSPGCRFEWKGDYLCFVDNAGYNGKVYFNMFETLMTLHNMSFYEACKFIYNECKVTKFKKLVTDKRIIRNTDIRFTYRQWRGNHCLNHLDLKASELKQANAYLVADYWCTSKYDPELVKNRIHNPRKTPIIAWYFPDSNRTKLYFIGQKEFRFYSNCSNDDIYGYHLLGDMRQKSNELIITKSGKDFCVLWFKYGFPCIAVQGETVRLTKKLLDACKHFDKIWVLFDNDEEGMRGAKRLALEINSSYPGKAKGIWINQDLISSLKEKKKDLKNIKDTSNLYEIEGMNGKQVIQNLMV